MAHRGEQQAREKREPERVPIAHRPEQGRGDETADGEHGHRQGVRPPRGVGVAGNELRVAERRSEGVGTHNTHHQLQQAFIYTHEWIWLSKTNITHYPPALSKVIHYTRYIHENDSTNARALTVRMNVNMLETSSPRLDSATSSTKRLKQRPTIRRESAGVIAPSFILQSRANVKEAPISLREGGVRRARTGTSCETAERWSEGMGPAHHQALPMAHSSHWVAL